MSDDLREILRARNAAKAAEVFSARPDEPESTGNQVLKFLVSTDAEYDGDQ